MENQFPSAPLVLNLTSDVRAVRDTLADFQRMIGDVERQFHRVRLWPLPFATRLFFDSVLLIFYAERNKLARRVVVSLEKKSPGRLGPGGSWRILVDETSPPKPPCLEVAMRINNLDFRILRELR